MSRSRLKRSGFLCLEGPNRIAAFAVASVLATSQALLAEGAEPVWFEMVRACETVIAAQSFRPLAEYEAAPFSSGKPGVKEYAVYSRSRELVVIARIEGDKWTHCWVREDWQNDRQRWREIELIWRSGFEAAFPKSTYAWVRTPNNPHQPFVGAVLCQEERSVLLVMPYLSGNFDFGVNVSSELPGRNVDHCSQKSG